MAEEENNRIFQINVFEDGTDEVICLCDIDFLARNGIDLKSPDFNPNLILEDKGNFVAARVRIDRDTGFLKKITFGINPLTGKEYSGDDIRGIVNTSAKVQSADDGRTMAELILSLSSGLQSISKSKKLKKLPNFIPPTEVGGSSLDLINQRMSAPKRSCTWLKNFIETKKGEKNKETFFFPWLANGHFGLLCIDMSKNKPITYFDSGDMFISEGAGRIEDDCAKRGKNFESTFGELVGYFDEERTEIDGYFPGPVNFYMVNGRIGQLPDETDCNYWVEALQLACCKAGFDSETFKRYLCDSNFIRKLKEEKDKIKSNTQNKASEYKLNEDRRLYPQRFGLGVGGSSTPEQPKKPSLFSTVEDVNDQSTTLKTSEKSKKVFKDIELIKITPKKVEEGQLSSSKLAEQIEQNGFTKEILENNIITIKRKNVEHFEPLRNFLLKNINNNLVGYNKLQSREI